MHFITQRLFGLAFIMMWLQYEHADLSHNDSIKYFVLSFPIGAILTMTNHTIIHSAIMVMVVVQAYNHIYFGGNIWLWHID